MIARMNGHHRTQAILIQTAILSAFGPEGLKAFKAALEALKLD